MVKNVTPESFTIKKENFYNFKVNENNPSASSIDFVSSTQLQNIPLTTPLNEMNITPQEIADIVGYGHHFKSFMPSENSTLQDFLTHIEKTYKHDISKNLSQLENIPLDTPITKLTITPQEIAEKIGCGSEYKSFSPFNPQEATLGSLLDHIEKVYGVPQALADMKRLAHTEILLNGKKIINYQEGPTSGYVINYGTEDPNITTPSKFIENFTYEDLTQLLSSHGVKSSEHGFIINSLAQGMIRGMEGNILIKAASVDSISGYPVLAEPVDNSIKFFTTDGILSKAEAKGCYIGLGVSKKVLDFTTTYTFNDTTIRNIGVFKDVDVQTTIAPVIDNKDLTPQDIDFNKKVVQGLKSEIVDGNPHLPLSRTSDNIASEADRPAPIRPKTTFIGKIIDAIKSFFQKLSTGRTMLGGPPLDAPLVKSDTIQSRDIGTSAPTPPQTLDQPQLQTSDHPQPQTPDQPQLQTSDHPQPQTPDQPQLQNTDPSKRQPTKNPHSTTIFPPPQTPASGRAQGDPSSRDRL